VGFPENDAGLHQAEFAATVVALAVVAVGQYLLAGQQGGNAIGELNFATCTTWLRADQVKYRRGQDVAAGVRM